jgi:hypothetical protein
MVLPAMRSIVRRRTKTRSMRELDYKGLDYKALGPHPEERAFARVSKDEAIDVGNATNNL